jgi:hypothetical protein
MNRGAFKDLSTIPPYRDTEKEWLVSIYRTECYWHDQTVSIIDELDCTTEIAELLKVMQRMLRERLDKRFVYFVGSRRRVRFSLQYPPVYSASTGLITYYVEVGRDRELLKIATPLRAQMADPRIEYTDKVLTYQFDADNRVGGSVHEFHLHNGINLGLATRVHYVGYTGRPSYRLIHDEHRGLADTLRDMPPDEYDIFHYYNLFTVVSYGVHASGARFVLANSMTDEVTVRDEGQLIEKALIYYFRTEQQVLNRKREIAELKNRLVALSRNLNIRSVNVTLEREPHSDYYRFFSTQVPPADRHEFAVAVSGGELILNSK